jgi:hypothetical protein
MVFVCSLESIKRIETEFITSHFPVIVYGIDCWKKIDNLWLPCSEGDGVADGLNYFEFFMKFWGCFGLVVNF